MDIMLIGEPVVFAKGANSRECEARIGIAVETTPAGMNLAVRATGARRIWGEATETAFSHFAEKAMVLAFNRFVGIDSRWRITARGPSAE